MFVVEKEAFHLGFYHKTAIYFLGFCNYLVIYFFG